MERVSRKLMWLILALLVYDAAVTFGQSPDAQWIANGTVPYHPPVTASRTAVAPYPGFWHCGTAGNFLYCPCFAAPYVLFTDPSPNGNTGYFRYDFSPLKLSYACGGQSAPVICGQGGPNHTDQALSATGYMIPLRPDPPVDNFYPTPDLLSGAGLGALWSQWNTATYPGTNYSNKMKANSVWQAAYQYKLPVMQADPGCQGGAVTVTPSRSPTVTTTPTAVGPTPSPSPNPYAAWIYQAVAEGYLVGCGGNKFCPGDSSVMQQGLLTRAQETVFLLKSVHGPTYTPPHCTPPGIFVDVVCQ